MYGKKERRGMVIRMIDMKRWKTWRKGNRGKRTNRHEGRREGKE